MALQENRPTHLLLYRSPQLCHGCGHDLGADWSVGQVELEIRSLTSKGDRIELQGEGRFTGVCPVCGMQVRAVQEFTRIHCEGLVCAKCGTPDELDVQVQRYSNRGDQFEFEATLTCRTCNRRSRFAQVLSRLSEILSIEIGLTGITLKAKKGEKE